MTNFSVDSNFEINKSMGSLSNENVGSPNLFDAVAASDVTTAAPAIVMTTTGAAKDVPTTTVASSTTAAALTYGWDAAVSTEAGATTLTPPTRDFKEVLNDLLIDAEYWAKVLADFAVANLWVLIIIGSALFFILFICCLCACLFHAGCLGEDAKARRRRRRRGPGGKGSDGYDYHAAPSTSRSFHEGENLPFYQATRDARIEEGEGGAVTLENKGSKGCSTLNGDKGKSTINRSTIKSHNSGDSGTGTLKKVNSAEMGNLTGQIMKELQAQGKSEDWTVGFAKMANALYLKDEDLDGFLLLEEARKVIHTYDKIYELNLILHNVDDSLQSCSASGGLVDLETLIRMLAAKHVPH